MGLALGPGCCCSATPPLDSCDDWEECFAGGPYDFEVEVPTVSNGDCDNCAMIDGTYLFEDGVNSDSSCLLLGGCCVDHTVNIEDGGSNDPCENITLGGCQLVLIVIFGNTNPITPNWVIDITIGSPSPGSCPAGLFAQYRLDSLTTPTAQEALAELCDTGEVQVPLFDGGGDSSSCIFPAEVTLRVLF